MRQACTHGAPDGQSRVRGQNVLIHLLRAMYMRAAKDGLLATEHT